MFVRLGYIATLYRKRSFLIAGGIGENDVERVLNFKHPQFAGVDLNSCFEISPGIKDIEKLNRFITKLKR